MDFRVQGRSPQHPGAACAPCGAHSLIWGTDQLRGDGSTSASGSYCSKPASPTACHPWAAQPGETEAGPSLGDTELQLKGCR